MKVVLQASTHELDEVMVVAFGTAKKSQGGRRADYQQQR